MDKEKQVQIVLILTFFLAVFGVYINFKFDFILGVVMSPCFIALWLLDFGYYMYWRKKTKCQ